MLGAENFTSLEVIFSPSRLVGIIRPGKKEKSHRGPRIYSVALMKSISLRGKKLIVSSPTRGKLYNARSLAPGGRETELAARRRKPDLNIDSALPGLFEFSLSGPGYLAKLASPLRPIAKSEIAQGGGEEIERFPG